MLQDIEDEPARCTPADKAMLKQLKEKLERAQTQASSSSGHEHIQEVERLTKVLQMEKLDIRDRLIREHFQKKYPDIRGTGELNVLTISNIDYGKYVNGPDENNPPTLSHYQTGIEKLRDQLCRAPSNARVESLKRHNLLIQQMLRRLKLSFSTAQRPRRDLVVAMFEAHTNLPMKKYQNIMNAAAASHKLGIMKLLKTTMVQDIETKIDDKWAKYPAATVASFFKKGGKHKHSIKKVVQKPEFWTAAILLIIDKHVIPLEALLFREVDKCSANIIEAMGNRIGGLVSEIEQLEQAGAVDIKEISEIWYKEKEAFEEEQISIASMIDTGSSLPAFATEMVGVYASAVTEVPPGTPQGAKKRFGYLKKSLFSMTGPLSKMGDEVSGQLKRRFEKWAREVDARIKLTFDNSKDALLNEFKGKRMSPERRAEVAPTIIAAADKALSSLQADLDAYNQDDDE
ncbi:hypothetical protein D6C95_10250 [Aureobasidium pullulans]|nr:hypothetical protein D6C95_10250 [Aureobasidium pullulans]